MKVKYFITKQKNPYSQIYVRFWNGRVYDAKASTGLKVLFNDWHPTKEAVKLKTSSADKDFINGKLMDLRKFLVENYNLEYNRGQAIQRDWLKNKVSVFFNRVDESQPEKTYFVDWIQKFVEDAPKRLYKGKYITESTIKKYNTALNNLINYQNDKKIRLTFQDITLNFYFDFVDYCKSTHKLGANTVGTRIKAIKYFCRQIDLQKLPISDHYKHPEFVAQEEKADDIYLTTTEIDKIFNFDFSDNPRLDNARDLFIIGINTGLRISDFMRLDLSHIKEDTIIIKAMKTDKIAQIPINSQIETVLNKRNGQLPHSISDSKFNQYLKEIGKMVGFIEPTRGAKTQLVAVDDEKKPRKVAGTYPKYELMTSHICRRSFATNLYGEIPTPVIMAITGHSTEQQFLTYIKKTAAENAEILRNFYKRKAEEKGLEFNLQVV